MSHRRTPRLLSVVAATVLVLAALTSPASADDDTYFSGDLRVGATLTVDGYPGLADVGFYSDPGCDHEITTDYSVESTVVPPSAAGGYVRVTWYETYQTENGGGSYDVSGACVGPIAGAPPLPTFEPPVTATVAGDAQVGNELTAVVNGSLSPAQGTTFGYVWRAGGSVVGTDPTYTPAWSTGGASLTVTVTAHHDGYQDSTDVSDAVTIEKIPGYTGTLRVGSTLTGTVAGGTAAFHLNADAACAQSSLVKAGTSYTIEDTYVGYYVRYRVDGVFGRCSGPIAAAAPMPTFVPPLTAAFDAAPQVGRQVTATVNDDLDPQPDQLLYSWKVGGNAVPVSGATYTPPLQYVGKTLSVTITAKKAGYQDSVDSVETTIANGPYFTGDPVIGQELTTPTPVTLFLYRNSECSGEAVDGAIPPLLLVDGMEGWYVQAGTGPYTGTCEGPIEADTPAFTTKPVVTVSGTPTVGEVLTADVTGGDPDAGGTTKSYQWFVGDQPADDGTGATFHVPASAAEEQVTVRVTSSADGYQDDVTTADPVTIAKGTFTIDPPTIDGSETVGDELTCAAPDVDGHVSYAWTRGADSLGSDPAYTPGAADLGEVLTCTVTVARSGYESASSHAATAEIGPGTFTVGQPTVTGTARVGQELTCEPPDLDSTPAFTWVRDGVDEVGSASTYDPTADDVGATLTCRIAVSRTGYEDATNESDGVEVAAGYFTLDAPTVVGTSRVGQELTCVPPDGLVGTPSYTWWYGTFPLSYDATYTPTPSQLGWRPECVMSVARPGYRNAIGSVNADLVEKGIFEILDPTIGGSAMVGGLLTCTAPEGDFETSVVWKRGADVADEGDEHLVTLDDLGEALTCEVTATRDGYEDATSSADTAEVGKGVLTPAPPTIVGTARVGETLTCLHDDADPQFAWTSGGLTAGTAPAYVVRPVDAGRVLTCTVTVSRPGYDDASASAQAGPVADGVLAIGDPTIHGDPAVGETLTCTAPSGAADARFSWLRGGTVVATGPVYVIGADDVDQVLTCRVDVLRPGYGTATASAAVGPVAAAPARSFTADLAGAPRVGSVLRGSVPDLPPGAVVSWQWLRDGGPVGGATGARYELLPDDHGHRFRVRATLVEPGHVAGTALSPVSDVVELRKLRLAVAPGRVRAGDQLEITVSNLVPGEPWTLGFGNGEWSIEGTAPAESQTLTRLVRIPRELSRYGERHLAVRTRVPERVGWAPVVVDE